MEKMKKLTSKSWFPALMLLIFFVGINSILNKGLTWSFVQFFILANAPAICVAIGVSATIIVAGTDISLGAIVSLVNVIIVTLAGKGFSVPTAALIALGVAVLCGMFNGFLIGVLRVNPLLTTYATSTAFSGIALWILPNPGGSVDSSFAKWYMGNLFGFFMTPVALILLLVILWVLVIKTPAGLKLYALGCDEKKAYASGVNVGVIRFFVHTYAGLAAGIAGICITANTCSGSPTIGSSMSLTSIAAAVIGGISLNGGIGSIGGGILGAAFLSILTSIVVAIGLSSYTQSLVQGLILLIGVVLSILAQEEKIKEKVRKIFAKGDSR